MADTAEEVAALSDDVDAGDDGTVSPTPATVPKKRGRPSNAEKPKKAATSTTGRGRGRPAKASESTVNKKTAKNAASADGSDEEGTGTDEGSPAFNGDSADGATAVASKRGRKPKAKRKLPNPIEATGKGRGRPKKISKPDDGEDEDEAADDDDGASNDLKPGKKATTKVVKKGRGRPKKVNNSDDESSDDKEERRPVGRPPTGAVNLNIIYTGRGQGRPKKLQAEKQVMGRVKVSESGSAAKPKRLGRPPKFPKSTYVPTGKPRGRPKKAVQPTDTEDERNGGIILIKDEKSSAEDDCYSQDEFESILN